MQGQANNTCVRGLWIGPELSVMERMSIASFLAHGHEYHLYVYGDVKGVPPGVVVRDANEILPASMVFQYKHSKSYAGFANFFRYQLLLNKGGWWVDTDVVCLKPFEFADEHVFASEEHKGLRIANNGIIKAPAASELMAYVCQVCRAKDPEQITWGETGPRLLDAAIRRFSLERHTKPHQVFCPLGFEEWDKVLDPDAGALPGEESYAVHLWNEMWRRGGRDKDGRYHPDCLYERLKRKYLPQ
jgi:mannosyltransferase OCH1-like enzyme